MGWNYDGRQQAEGQQTENKISFQSNKPKQKYCYATWQHIFNVVMQLLRNSDEIYMILMQFQAQRMTVCRNCDL